MSGQDVPLSGKPGRLCDLEDSAAMTAASLTDLFGLDGRVAVVTGASGVLGGAIARGLAAAGAQVGLLARRRTPLEELAETLGAAATVLEADVLDAPQLEHARAAVLERFGRIDILVNAAGGNMPAATVGERSFFELPPDALDDVVRLNFQGTVLPSQVFGAAISDGSIVNISSLAAHRALTRVVGYGAAKAAVENLTRWLAVELAPRGVRVNAVAPGFFVGEQNRALLLDESGALTARGERIVAATPAGRFGEPDELAGTVIWLCSTAASFVTGVVVPVDGGFNAFAGV
jgi:NAD(P)-dependent dehydrogenase (short-subunit alcohol dehydrogenase family)